MFAFDYNIKEIEYGKRCTADGGTMPFNSLLKEINKRTKENLINIVITDAEMEIDEKDITDLLKELKGLLIFISNQTNSATKTIENISKNNKTKLVFIQADSDFTIKH